MGSRLVELNQYPLFCQRAHSDSDDLANNRSPRTSGSFPVEDSVLSDGEASVARESAYHMWGHRPVIRVETISNNLVNVLFNHPKESGFGYFIVVSESLVLPVVQVVEDAKITPRRRRARAELRDSDSMAGRCSNLHIAYAYPGEWSHLSSNPRVAIGSTRGYTV